MRKGKMCSQAAHAAVMSIFDGTKPELTLDTLEWLETHQTKITLQVGSEAELKGLLENAKTLGLPTTMVTDIGTTEFSGVPTITCGAIGPADFRQIDIITGDLKLL